MTARAIAWLLVAWGYSIGYGQTLYNNAVAAGLHGEGLRTGPRQGEGDYSEVQSGNAAAGSSFRLNAARLADDFLVVKERWRIREVSVFGYQTGAITPTITSGAIEIRAGDYKNLPIAYRAFSQSDFINVYRIFNNMPDDLRRVQRIRYTFNTILAPGRYWLVFHAFGNGQLSGPWGPYLTKVGALTTPGANAKQLVYGETIHWVDVYDAGSLLPQDLPFWIDGEKLPITAQPGPEVRPPTPVPDPLASLFRFSSSP